MRRLLMLATVALTLAPGLAAAQTTATPKPPAQYKSAGAFTGGSAGPTLRIPSIRFGTQEEGRATRMVIDLEQGGSSGVAAGPAGHHPAYNVELQAFPYRLIVRLADTFYLPAAKVDRGAALPFSVVAAEDGRLREIQVFLPGPSEVKVIEIDDPAKLSIDVRPLRQTAVPTVYTVQITNARNAEEAFALVEQGSFPDGFSPSVLVLGSLVVLEQAFTDPSEAARLDAQLRALGYSTVINERRGDELPQL